MDEVGYGDRLSDKRLDNYCGKHLPKLFIIDLKRSQKAGLHASVPFLQLYVQVEAVYPRQVFGYQLSQGHNTYVGSLQGRPADR